MGTTEYDFFKGEVCEIYRKTLGIGSFDKLVNEVLDYFKENDPTVPTPGLLAATTDYIRAYFEDKCNLEDDFLYEANIFDKDNRTEKIIKFRAKVGEKKFREVEYNPKYFDKFGFLKDGDDTYKLVGYYLCTRDE